MELRRPRRPSKGLEVSDRARPWKNVPPHPLGNAVKQVRDDRDLPPPSRLPRRASQPVFPPARPDQMFAGAKRPMFPPELRTQTAHHSALAQEAIALAKDSRSQNLHPIRTSAYSGRAL